PRPRRPRGRPTLLTTEVRHLMVAAIKGGATFKDAAIACGVSPATAAEWMARGLGADPDRAPRPIDVAFASEIRKAGATARIVATNRLFETNPAKWLAHADPAAWGSNGIARQEPETRTERKEQS